MQPAGPDVPLVPADHVRILHPLDRRGIVTLARGGDGWTEKAIPIADLPRFAACMAGKADLFVSQQSFYGWRRISQLAQLGATYVDLDFHRGTRWSEFSPDYVTGAVLRALDDAAAPNPSYILSTGRGLLAVWLHSFVPREALPRWMAVQKQLARILAPFGADPRALDAARVFRLAGTENTKVGTLVRPTYLATAPADLWRWGFDDLAHEVLPWERSEIATFEARRLARTARGKEAKPTPACKRTEGTYWGVVLSDLQQLRRVRWFGTLPPGERDEWLFIACVAMSWLAPPLVLQREFNALAKEAGGWDEREVKSRMCAVFRRAEAAAAGRVTQWEGKTVDPRYRFRASTIVERLRITPAEMREANLRVLVDDDVARERAAERQQVHRRRIGLQERSAYEAPAQIRRGRVLELRQQGMTIRAIAGELGISRSEVHRLAAL